MAMALFSDVQAKVQKEIDETIGHGRLPSFHDRNNLTYMECVFKECLRWGTPAPLSVPHRLMQRDTVYNGYVLPAGSICIGNIWRVLHDERIYTMPQLFQPERFQGDLDSEKRILMDPANYVYGFGRRRCPGNHFAHSAVWISMVSLLAAFVISPDVDEQGNEIEVKPEFEPGAIRHTKPFRCRTPRLAKVADLLASI